MVLYKGLKDIKMTKQANRWNSITFSCFKTFLILFLFLPDSYAKIEGFAYPHSITQGEDVSIFVSTDDDTFDIHIYREGAAQVEYYAEYNLPGVLQNVSSTAYKDGVDWSPAIALNIPDNWPSGVYTIAFDTPNSERTWGIFTVRSNNPGVNADILFQMTLTTWQAYNNWGGKSLYAINSTGGRSSVVSFKRPFASDHYSKGRGKFTSQELPFIRWLEQNNYKVEYSTSLDTHSLPDLHKNYKIFMTAGHDEYWSWEMRDNIESRISDNKKIAIFSGNSVWWQIRFSNDMSQMICYKTAENDPLYGINNDLVTSLWHAEPVNRPENSLLGISYRYAGLVNTSAGLTSAEGYGGFFVERPNHWAFENTNVKTGDVFGYDAAIVGPETDGAMIVPGSSPMLVSGDDGTPKDFIILATSPAILPPATSQYPDHIYGTATMGIFGIGDGTVFNAATIKWSNGLKLHDPIVQQITRNVLNNFLLDPLPAVSITGFTPTYGQPGSLINISGLNFSYGNKPPRVYFNNIKSTQVTVISDIVLQAELPDGDTTGPIKIVNRSSETLSLPLIFGIEPDITDVTVNDTTVSDATDTETKDSYEVSDNENCFIATAAYGSYLHDDVKVLRHFRDQYLLTNDTGKAFVNIYYLYSPPIADFIRQHESLRATTRILLTPLVYSIKYPVSSLTLAASTILLVSVGISRIRRKRQYPSSK